MLDVLDEHSKVQNLIILLIVTITMTLVMGYFSQQFLTLSGGLPIPDTRLGYTFTEIQDLFSTVGQEGLLVYRNLQILDMFYPLAYSLAFVAGIMIAIRSCPERFQKIRMAGLVPIVAAVFDYIENILIATQAQSYPILDETVISIASAFTMMKWLTLLISLIVFLIFGSIALASRMKVE